MQDRSSRIRRCALVASITCAAQFADGALQSGAVLASEDFPAILEVIEPRLIIERDNRHWRRMQSRANNRLVPAQSNGAEEADQTAAFGTTISPASASGTAAARWGASGEGMYTHLKSTGAAARFRSETAAGGTSLDYLVNDRFLVGVAFSYNDTVTRHNIAGALGGPGRLNTESYGVGPYFGLALTDILILNGSFLHSWGKNKLRDQASAGAHNFEGWNAGGALTAHLSAAGFSFAPTVGISYSENRDKAYVDSLAFPFPAQTTRTGVMKFGASLSHTIALSEGNTLTPSLSVDGSWEFLNSVKPPPTVGVVNTNINSKGVDVALSGGLAFKTAGGLSLSLTGSAGGLARKNYEVYSVGGNLSISF